MPIVLEREELGISRWPAGPLRRDLRRVQLPRALGQTASSSTRCASTATSINELEHNLLLCYTGRTRLSDHIIDDQTARYKARTPRPVDGLRRQKTLAREMKDALLRNRLSEFGELLGEAWQQKRRMSPKIATPFIDEAYDAGDPAGRPRRQGHRGRRRRLHARSTAPSTGGTSSPRH